MSGRGHADSSGACVRVCVQGADERAIQSDSRWVTERMAPCPMLQELKTVHERSQTGMLARL